MSSSADDRRRLSQSEAGIQVTWSSWTNERPGLPVVTCEALIIEKPATADLRGLPRVPRLTYASSTVTLSKAGLKQFWFSGNTTSLKWQIYFYNHILLPTVSIIMCQTQFKGGVPAADIGSKWRRIGSDLYILILFWFKSDTDVVDSNQCL